MPDFKKFARDYVKPWTHFTEETVRRHSNCSFPWIIKSFQCLKIGYPQHYLINNGEQSLLRTHLKKVLTKQS